MNGFQEVKGDESLETNQPNTSDSLPKSTTDIYTKLSLFQFKALLLKNLRLQWLQWGSNMFHVLTPVLILVLMWLLIDSANEVISLNKSDFLKKPLFPMVHNLPLGLVKQSSLFPVATSSCYKWFLFSVDEQQASLEHPLVKSVLSEPLREYCKEAQKFVPHFQQANSSDINPYVSEQIRKANQAKLLPGRDVEDVEVFPDGAIHFRQASEMRFSAKIQLNDMPIAEYHINNGFTKSTYRLSDLMKDKLNEYGVRKNLKNMNASWPVSCAKAGLDRHRRHHEYT